MASIRVQKVKAALTKLARSAFLTSMGGFLTNVAVCSLSMLTKAATFSECIPCVIGMQKASQKALRTDGEDASTEQGKTSNSVRSCAHCASFPSTVYASDQMRSTRCKKGAARTSCNMRTSAATDDASSPAKCRVCASCRKRPEMVSNPHRHFSSTAQGTLRSIPGGSSQKTATNRPFWEKSRFMAPHSRTSGVMTVSTTPWPPAASAAATSVYSTHTGSNSCHSRVAIVARGRFACVNKT
ncbi:hypothetical protein DIPPA_23329 [Diplonema papillatum]|nr:hypothetical protein DIPPA_23329 [Diplonema papillatum]